MTTVMLCVSSYLFPFVPTEEVEDEEEALKSFLPEKVFLLLLLRGRCCLSGVWGGIDVGGRRRRKGRRAEEAAREEEREKKKGEDPYSVPFGALLLSFLDALLKRGGGGGERPIIRVFPFSLFFLSFCFSSKLVGIFFPCRQPPGERRRGGCCCIVFLHSLSHRRFFAEKYKTIIAVLELF